MVLRSIFKGGDWGIVNRIECKGDGVGTKEYARASACGVVDGKDLPMGYKHPCFEKEKVSNEPCESGLKNLQPDSENSSVILPGVSSLTELRLFFRLRTK